jgi:hypothetical protein
MKIWDRVYVLMIWLPVESDAPYSFWLGAEG